MEDNKYAIVEDEKRIVRRKRNRRNRVLAWIFLLIFVVLLAILAVWGFGKLKPYISFGGKETVTESVSTVTPEEVTPPDEESNVSETIDTIIGEEDEVVVYEPSPEDTKPTEDDLFEEAVREYVNAMSLEDRIAGIFVVFPEQITGVDTVIQAGDGTKQALIDNPVGGIVYRGMNIISADQFKTMLGNTASFAVRPLFLAVNEELGNTVISSKLNLYKSDSESVLGASGSADNAYIEAGQIADYLNGFGINLNLGIVSDLSHGNGSTVMADRTFSRETKVTSDMVNRTIDAYEEKNIHTGVCYFPGQSFANQDTGDGIATSTRTRPELEYNEFMILKNAVAEGADIVVVSHVLMPSLTGEVDAIQCSLSRIVMTDVIREELGLNDVIIMTDDMGKAAISEYYESGESAVKAIKAGADMVMCPVDYKEAYEAVLDAVNNKIISEMRISDSLVRIYKVKFKGKTPEEIRKMLEN